MSPSKPSRLSIASLASQPEIAILADVADAPGPHGRKALNSTAYRIFKLLHWLMQEAHSVDELNQRFLTDTRIARRVSADSIWLYVNTLKALGCKIRRPCPTNGFRYELLYHPFGLQLTDNHLEMLAHAKSMAQREFNHTDIRVLDRLIKKIIRHSDCQDPETTIQKVFEHSRSIDTESCQQLNSAMDSWIQDQSLLRLTYHSPVKGKEQLFLLPEAFLYEQGVLYLRGDRPEYEHPSSLRFDRILAAEPVEDAALRENLLARRQQQTEVHLHLFAEHPADFDGFNLGEAHGVYTENWQALSEPLSGYDVRLSVRDFFYLKQRLLASGCPFRILHPLSFRQDMQETLLAMRQLYDTEEPADGRP